MAQPQERRGASEIVLHRPAQAEEGPPAKGSNALIEFSTEARDDPNEGLQFGDMPERCLCPHCQQQIVTFLDHEASWITWVLGFVVWFSLGWMAFWVLPLLWPAFKDVVHHCPRCLNVVARKSRISLPTFKTEVMTCKIGNCAVVLARKYVAILIALVLLIVGASVLRSTLHLQMAPEFQKGAPSMLTWEDFLFDCGPKTSLRQRTGTAAAFETYRRRTFKWQGEVKVIREGFEVMFLKTKSVMMMRMYPSRFPRRDVPDVALLFGEEVNEEVAELVPGDWVEFEATMTAHGFRGDPEVMTLWHVKKVPQPTPLSSSGGLGRHSHHQEGQHPPPEANEASEEAPPVADAPPAANDPPAKPQDQAPEDKPDAKAGGAAEDRKPEQLEPTKPPPVPTAPLEVHES